jgi:hypothetical protein
LPIYTQIEIKKKSNFKCEGGWRHTAGGWRLQVVVRGDNWWLQVVVVFLDLLD